MADDIAYIRARSLSEAIAHLAAGGARLMAGGTDLPVSLEIDGDRTSKVVDITALAELRGVTPTPDGGLRIGALSSLEDVAASPAVRGRYVGLERAAAAAQPAGSQARPTLGGNVCQRPRCWYLRSRTGCVRQGGDLCFAADGENRYHGILGSAGCYMTHPSDVAPALVALDARARIVGPAGLRVVPFEEFFLPPSREVGRENVLSPAEILTDALLPPVPPGWRSTYRRVSEAGTDDALASVAASMLAVEGAVVHLRIVLGAAAPIPWRAVEAEAVLLGAHPDRVTIARAADAAMADAMPLSENGYKVGLFRALLIDALEEVAGLRPLA